MRIPRHRSTRQAVAAALFAVAGLAACSHKPELTPVQVAQKDMAEFQAEIRKVVKDSSRAEQLVALTSEFQATVVTVAGRDSALQAAVTALDADFGATRDQYVALHEKARAARREFAAKLASLRLQMAAVATADEWEQLKKVRVTTMDAELSAMEI